MTKEELEQLLKTCYNWIIEKLNGDEYDWLEEYNGTEETV